MKTLPVRAPSFPRASLRRIPTFPAQPSSENRPNTSPNWKPETGNPKLSSQVLDLTFLALFSPEHFLPNPLIARVCTPLHVNQNFFSTASRTHFSRRLRPSRSFPSFHLLRASGSLHENSLKKPRHFASFAKFRFPAFRLRPGNQSQNQKTCLQNPPLESTRLTRIFRPPARLFHRPLPPSRPPRKSSQKSSGPMLDAPIRQSYIPRALRVPK
jgi:hypothetical protein